MDENSTPPPAISLALVKYPEEFAIAFVHWCIEIGETGYQDWYHLKNLANEFADVMQYVPLSSMILSKALARLGLERRYRYLREGDLEYRSKLNRGTQRPRVCQIKIPSSALWDLSTAQ